MNIARLVQTAFALRFAHCIMQLIVYSSIRQLATLAAFTPPALTHLLVLPLCPSLVLPLGAPLVVLEEIHEPVLETRRDGLQTVTLAGLELLRVLFVFQTHVNRKEGEFG